MRNPAVKLLRSLPLIALLLAGASPLFAQTSNRLWFVTYNGQPMPSGDISVRSLATDGTATPLASAAATGFVAQTNFSAFNSPYDVVVDAVMGKVYVLDNNLSGTTPEYVYAFNLSGTPSQIAASAQIIYTMPVPAADVTANLYPLVSGLALDPFNHYLYLNQIDYTVSTNSFIGRLDLATSSKSNTNSLNAGDPAFHQYYTGLVPGQGLLALDTTNLYLGAINRNGNSGVFTAPRDGTGSFSELVTLSSGDPTFANGLIGGVASDPPDHLVYYLTFNAGVLNQNFSTAQNALWTYDTIVHTTKRIRSGYPGYPDNLALDLTSSRYYFTLGRDGTGNATPTNYQAIYTGSLASTNAPTLLYTPVLGGQDTAGQVNAGNTVIQGIFVQNLLPANAPPTNRVALVRSTNGVNVLYSGTPGSNYVIQAASPVNGTYGDVSPVLPADSVGIIDYHDTTFPLLPSRFYRARTAP